MDKECLTFCGRDLSSPKNPTATEDWPYGTAERLEEVHKRKVREEQFPKDMEAAYEIGRRLTVFE